MMFDSPFPVATPGLLRLYVEDGDATFRRAVRRRHPGDPADRAGLGRSGRAGSRPAREHLVDPGAYRGACPGRGGQALPGSEVHRGHGVRAVDPRTRLDVPRDVEEVVTTLGNRPNTALLVVDVQNGAVEGRTRDAVVANVGRLVEKARRERIPVVWVQHSDEELAGERRLADRPRAESGRRRAARRQELRRLLRGPPGDRAVGPRSRPARRRRRADR